MLIGLKVPNTGPIFARTPIGDLGRMLEQAGADSLWVSDHIVMPRSVDSDYPFASNRRVTWSTEVDWYDAVIAMAQLAVTTTTARIGVCVLVLPLRNPVEFAKQIASIVAQPHGDRLVLGVGAGWMKEEFDALGVPFDSRGGRLEEWIAIARDCWTGYPDAFAGEHYALPGGMVCLPALETPPPFLIGGMSAPALRRAGSIADGWLGHYDLPDLDVEAVAAAVETVRRHREEAERAAALEFPLRIVKTEGPEAIRALARQLPGLRDAGITEVIVDLDWSSDDVPAAAGDALEVLRNA